MRLETREKGRENERERERERKNKAGYTATLGAVLEKVTRASRQEPYAQKDQKH